MLQCHGPSRESRKIFNLPLPPGAVFVQWRGSFVRIPYKSRDSPRRTGPRSVNSKKRNSTTFAFVHLRPGVVNRHRTRKFPVQQRPALERTGAVSRRIPLPVLAERACLGGEACAWSPASEIARSKAVRAGGTSPKPAS